MARPLYEIAEEIRKDYASKGKPVYWAAKPYVEAMASLDKITDRYFEDDGKSIVIYALSNLSSWRGETATRVRAELKELVK